MRVEKGDITKPACHAIVNAANGVGIMGKGVSGAIARSAGEKIVQEAKEKVHKNGGPFEPGNVFSTKPYFLSRRGVKIVYHAVTMKYPGGVTSLDFVTQCMRNALNRAIADEIKSIAIPGLGTGIGRIDKDLAATTMVTVAKTVDHLIDIKFIDKDDSFIEAISKLIER